MAEIEKQTLVRIKCPSCGNIDEFEVPRVGLNKRARGVIPAVAFPELPPERLAQLGDHVCLTCRNKGDQ